MTLYTNIPCGGCERCMPSDPPCYANLCDGTGLRIASDLELIKAAKEVEGYVIVHNTLAAQLNLFDPIQAST